MRLALILLFGFPAMDSAALITPEKAQMEALQVLLDRANQAQGEYKAVMSDYEKGRADKDAVNILRDVRARAWKRVIDGVLIAYGMALPFPSNPNYARLPKMTFAYGDYKGQKREWVIAFSDLPLGAIIAEQIDPRAFRRFEEHRKKSYAITTVDGTTTIFKTDYKTPAQLAFTLFHERSHYDQFADPAFKDSTASEREVVSWKSGLANIDAFGFTPEERKEMRRWAGKMVVQEEMKSIVSRGHRNLKNFGNWVLDALPGVEADARQEMETSIEDVTVDAGVVAALRKDAERIAGEVDQESKVRELLGVAEEICASPNRITYDDPLQAKYRRVEPVSGDTPQASPDACLQEVFELLWRSKAQGDRNADWSRAADIALGYTTRSEYHVPVSGGGRAEVAAALPPAPAVAARIDPPAEAARAWTTDYALNLLASKGCADPWAVSQTDLDRHWSGLLGMTPDEGAAGRLGLQGCQDRLFRSLIAMAAERLPARLTQEVFARTAEAARNPAPAYVPDDMPDIPGVQAPTVPTCRHHPWCQQWRGDGR